MRLQSIKREYGHDLSWMTPFPGDWHILKNVQEVLLKIYYSAGLCQLAMASGYQSKSIGTNFKRTHNFYWKCGKPCIGTFSPFSCPKRRVSLPQSTDQSSAQKNLVEMFADLSDKYDYQSEFSAFMNIHMKKEETFKFWGQFVLQDCSAYVALYLAIRSGNWKLRMAAIKSTVHYSQLLTDKSIRNLYHNIL